MKNSNSNSNNNDKNNIIDLDMDMLMAFIILEQNESFINQFSRILSLNNQNNNSINNDQTSIDSLSSIVSPNDAMKLMLTSIKHQNVDILEYLLENNV